MLREAGEESGDGRECACLGTGHANMTWTLVVF